MSVVPLQYNEHQDEISEPVLPSGGHYLDRLLPIAYKMSTNIDSFTFLSLIFFQWSHDPGALIWGLLGLLTKSVSKGVLRLAVSNSHSPFLSIYITRLRAPFHVNWMRVTGCRWRACGLWIQLFHACRLYSFFFFLSVFFSLHSYTIVQPEPVDNFGVLSVYLSWYVSGVVSIFF